MIRLKTGEYFKNIFNRNKYIKTQWTPEDYDNSRKSNRPIKPMPYIVTHDINVFLNTYPEYSKDYNNRINAII
jgi:hypothetical protein